MDQRHISRAGPRPSFLQEHGRSIVAGVLVIVIAAAIVALSPDVRDRVCDPLPFCGPIELDDRAYGRWEFVSSNPDPLPETAPGVTVEWHSLVLSEDLTFISDVSQVMQGVSMPVRTTGTIKPTSSTAFQVIGDDGTFNGANSISFEGNDIMHMTDASGLAEITWRRQT
jgi:hypothetical protein